MAEADQTLTLSPRYIALAFLAVAGSWGWLLYVAHYYWGGNSYYNFGWFVPLLGGYFLYQRLKEARFSPQQPGSSWRLGLFWAALAAAVAIVWALRILGEANIFWRAPLWGHGILLLGLSYGALWLFAGWRGLRHFGFLLFFILMALPWPLPVENAIIQSLTGWVTDLTVVVINLIGYPAMALGNTIHIGDTSVGVEEACSGIRSLQALIMVALFCGEFYRFGIFRRFGMLAGAVGISMLFNGTRAVTLTLIKIGGDQEKFDTWHDFFGNFNAIIGVIFVFAVAELLQILFGRGKTTTPEIRWTLAAPRQWQGVLGAIVAGFLAAEIGMQGYFIWNASRLPPLEELVLDFSSDENLRIEQGEIDEMTWDALGCEFGSQSELAWSNGTRATMVHYGFTGEDRLTSLSSLVHSPKVCMRGVGAELNVEKLPLTVELNGKPWQAQHFEFVTTNGASRQKIQVYWLVWEQQKIGFDISKWYDLKNRFLFALDGRRSFAREVILVYFHGEDFNNRSRQRFADLIDRIVVEPEAAASAGAS
ncbi:MAG: exosortase/archaeosortase family protein [Puniceicoccaceae bacterium]